MFLCLACLCVLCDLLCDVVCFACLCLFVLVCVMCQGDAFVT